MAIVKRINNIDSIFVDNKSKNAIIMIHGYGASYEDLYPLHSYVKANKDFDWYFPNGTLEVPIGPMMSGRAWFPIDMEALTQAQLKGEFRDFKSAKPQNFDGVLASMRGFLEELSTYDNIILSGFSQGAMLSSHLMFSDIKNLKAVALLSAVLVDFGQLKNYPNKSFKVFQSHGKSDEVLDYKGAVDLRDELEAKGCEIEFHEFGGGHEIPMNILESLSTFVDRIF
jgi:phospholipase/carboxylesterase